MINEPDSVVQCVVCEAVIDDGVMCEECEEETQRWLNESCGS